MPNKVRTKTVTPPPKLALGEKKGPSVEECSSGSIEKIAREHTRGPATQTQGNVSNMSQASNRISALFDSMQDNPRSRSTSPDLESTPRPLRVLKGRKSFLSLNSGVSSRTTTPTPHGFRPKTSPDRKPKGSNMLDPRQSPPARSFLGLRLSSPKPRVLYPANQPLPRGNLQVIEPQTAKPKPTEARFSLGPGLRLPQASNADLTRQNTMSSASTETSSNSIKARSSVSHWMNWRQRSISDSPGPGVKARSMLLDEGPSRAIKVAQPSIIYESMRHVESKLPTPASSISHRMPRRASSAGPGFLLEQGVSGLKFTGPLTPRPPTLTNIESSGYAKVGSVGKSGILSKVLCSIPDISPLSGNQDLAVSTTTKYHSLRQSSEGKVAEATAHVEPTMSRRGSLSERPAPAETLKSKGTLKARSALGSIRRRFGSVSERTLKTTEEEAPTLMPNIVQPHFQKEWIPPPILQLQLDIHSESSREHIEGGREIWICIEVEGRISNFQESSRNLLCDRDPRGLDVAIVLDLSAHASPATFKDTKSMAKHLINSLSAIDNVSLTAFTSIQSSPGVETKYPLSRLTQSNKQQLFSFIDGLFGQAERQGTIRRDVKSILMGVIDDLKGSTNHETPKESGRTSHLFLLTSSLKHGDIPTGAFESPDTRIKVHIFGVGPLVTLQERPGKGTWVITLDPSPGNGISDGSEIFNTLHNRIPTLPRILDSMRHTVNFGELTNIQIGLSPCDGCRIVEVLGGTAFDRLVPGEKRTLCVKLKIGAYNPASAPGTSMNTPDKNKDRQIKPAPRKVSVDKALDVLKRAQMINDAYDQGIISEYKLLERQLAATLGDIETSALAVSVSYEHEYFGAETVITTKKILKVQRYDGDGNWSLSRNPTINSSGEVFEGNSEDCGGSICSTDFLIPSVAQESGDEHYDGDVEYVRARLAKKIAEMALGEVEENPRKALRMVEELGIRGKGVYAVASELEWRVKIQEEEEETERTMRDLADEISGKRASHTLAFESRSSSALPEESTNNSKVDCTPNRANKHLSSHYQNPGSLDASGIEIRQGVQQKADIVVRRPRDSSIIIHPVTLSDRPSSSTSQSGESGESDPDEARNTGFGDMPEIQPSRRRHDVDEAGRIWRELAETKMGLRNIRPGRHRTPTLLPPMPRHSWHNSIDLLKDRHDKERTVDPNRALLISGRVKGKKKEMRRRMKKQAMARSITGEGGLRTGCQMPAETVLSTNQNPECGTGQEVASKTTVGEEKKRKDLVPRSTLLHGRYEEHNVSVTKSQDASMLLTSQASIGQEESGTNNEQSNRDTMKSLITLRDVKETDFSPWAC